MTQLNRFVLSAVMAASFVSFGGCGKASHPQADLGKNLVTAGNSSLDVTVGESGRNFRVMAQGAERAATAKQGLVSPNSAEGKAYLEKFTGNTGDALSSFASIASSTTDPTSLVVGIPAGLIGEQYLFDGVITKVSDPKNADLGDLKLSDLTGIQVKLALQGSGANAHLALLGCLEKCTESSPLQDVQDIPVVSIDTANNLIMVDLAPISKDLDLMSMLDPGGDVTHLQTVSTKTTAFDYSMSTLVFDVESHMIPVGAKPTDPGVSETVITTRWFLRLNSAFNPAFESRTPTDGVGFFLTQRAADPKIVRWSTTSEDGGAPVHYYIKNVPAEYQAAFKAAFDEWNTKLSPIVGKNIFSYEFVANDDPRAALLVPGDPRYNIVEWDLDNVASYGGLGPAISNQFTGENVTSNVLIQGPTIETLYKDWFKINKQAQQLRSEGKAKAADVLLIETRHELLDRLDDLSSRPKLKLTKGSLVFKIHAQLPELADPMAQRNDFDPLPAGLDYDKYMYGYFRGMVSHELGHNLGLRHNFKGNLGSTGDGEGQVSRSVMEYLSRDYRYQDHIDPYDLMALTYGYTGVKPAHTDWYCTDEDQATADDPSKSAECTPDDATADPFGWYQSRLALAINYLVDRDSKDAPVWTVDDMARELKIAVIGMGYYAFTADSTSSTWENFFTGGDRPSNAAGVKAYVISKLKAQICDPGLDQVVSSKSSAQAQAKTADNIAALRAKVAEILAPLKIITSDDIKCEPASSASTLLSSATE